MRESADRAVAEARSGIPRWIEAAIAGAALLVLAPLLAVLGLAVRLSSPGPILFRQERVGRAGRLFALIKFRTMRENGTGPLYTVRGDGRTTPTGRFLRRTKLDELPELWNVVRGDMSLVGPRPEVPHYVDVDDPAWAEVLRYRPGLTDPVTIALLNEEELLDSVPGDRDRFYREVLVPFKLEGYARYLRRRTVRLDVHVLGRSLVAIAFPRALPPTAFTSVLPRSSPIRAEDRDR